MRANDLGGVQLCELLLVNDRDLLFKLARGPVPYTHHTLGIAVHPKPAQPKSQPHCDSWSLLTNEPRNLWPNSKSPDAGGAKVKESELTVALPTP